MKNGKARRERELRLKKLVERELDTDELTQVSGGRKEQSRGDSRYCALSYP